MLTISAPLLLALIAAVVLLALIAAANGRRATRLRQARDQAIADAQGVYAQGHADGLDEARRRFEGEVVTASTAYRRGFEAGQGTHAPDGRRSGRGTTRAA